MAIQIISSTKVGLNSKESYVIIRDKTSFLRILGCEPEWELMTATASEDHGRIKVCGNQRRLVEAALRLGAELGTQPTVEKDWIKREYVKICRIYQAPDLDDKAFNKELQDLFEKFFSYYDDYQEPSIRGNKEMQELYDMLAIDDQNCDVYLSDGVWLRSDGSIHDRGR
ncbi:hypothetical protein ACJW8F_16370 [Plesiomonas shigelloides]|uniref:hypothetical protein n=1 Tax=Plesiomonas shigelloides TaxID=703 RepID=UPI00387EF966